MNKLPPRVVWSEGMLMAPQHLQQQDLYHEALQVLRTRALSPFDWGVASLEVDREALAAGRLQISGFLGIFPDGSLVAFERGDALAPAARPVDPIFPAKQRILEVFVGVPKERSADELFAPGTDTSGNARFATHTRQVSDLNAASSVISMAFAQPKVKLLCGNEPREDFETIKIAELTRNATGALAVVEAYVPPCLRVSASPSILEGLHGLLRSMVAKQRELADSRRLRDASTVEFTAQEMTRFLQLSALSGTVPVFHHIVDAGNLTPQYVYVELLKAAGALSTFAEEDPSGLPPFRYTDLRATFQPLFEALERMLRSVAVEGALPIPLDPRSQGLYLGALDDERLMRCPQFILAVKSQVPEQEVIEKLPQLAKIAARDELPGLLRAATPGVPIKVTYRPPAAVPVKPGIIYFDVGIQDQYWKNAMQAQSVALYLPPPFDSGTEVELLAVPPPSNR